MFDAERQIMPYTDGSSGTAATVTPAWLLNPDTHLDIRGRCLIKKHQKDVTLKTQVPLQQLCTMQNPSNLAGI